MPRFQKFKQKWDRDDGVSIVVALVVLLAVTLACTTLFYTINSSIRNAGQGRDREQALLLAQSLSQEVVEEVEHQNSEIGEYLSSNIGPAWPYEDTKNPNPFEDPETRTFTEDIFHHANGFTDALNAKVEIAMYWQSDFNTEFESEDEKYTGRTLFVTTTVIVYGSSGPQKATVVSVYDYDEYKYGTGYWWTYRGEE